MPQKPRAGSTNTKEAFIVLEFFDIESYVAQAGPRLTVLPNAAHDPPVSTS